MNFTPNMFNMSGMPNMPNMPNMANMANIANMPNMPNANMPNMANANMPNMPIPPNMLNSNITIPIMDPRNANRQNKDMIINRNIYMSGYGIYQMCPTRSSIKVKYRKDFNRGITKGICKVFVKHMHSIDIVEGLTNKGLTELKSNNPIPAVINPMYREFNGNNAKSDDAAADENMILRTNFAFIAKRQENLFPLSGESEVVYSNPITVIRTPYYIEIPHENLYKMGVITITPNRPELIEHTKKDGDKYEKMKTLSSKDLFKLQAQIETAFQVAAITGHNSVVISLFDQEFGIPVDDQMLIYNYCILKYGHFFNAIIFGIPTYQSEELVEYIDEIVVKPQKIAADTEMSATVDIINKKFVKTQFGEEEGESDAEEEEPDISNMTDSEKIKYMKNKVKNKKIQIRAQAEKQMKKSKKTDKSKSAKSVKSKSNKSNKSKSTNKSSK